MYTELLVVTVLYLYQYTSRVASLKYFVYMKIELLRLINSSFQQSKKYSQNPDFISPSLSCQASEVSGPTIMSGDTNAFKFRL
jgi:hypothetical protein